MKRGHVEQWSVSHRWRARAAAWDAEVAKRAREAQLAEHVLMAECHARTAETTLAALNEPIRELRRRLATDAAYLDSLGAKELIQLAVVCGKALPQVAGMERQARSVLTESVVPSEAIGAQASESEMTDEHLIQLWVALDEIGIRPHPSEPGRADSDPGPRGER